MKKTNLNLWDKAKNKDYRVREALAESLGKKRAAKENLDLTFFLLNDSESLVRIQALKSLMLIGEKKYFKKVVPMLNDKEEIVRINAVECVAALGRRDAIRYLKKHINDRSEIVRSFIGASIGEIGARKEVSTLEKRLEVEKSPLAKVGLLEGLYQLGQEKRLLELLCLLSHPKYHVRCAVANSASEIINRDNKKLIREMLSQALKYETAVAVIDSIKETLKIMKTFSGFRVVP